MSDVMISYSRRDVEFVKRLHGKLSELGRDVWVDFEDIPKTADWWEEIRTGIEEADNFAFVISPDSIESEVCGWEIQHAIELKKRLIPVLHREVTDPETKEKMREELNAHNWIFARDGDDFDKVFDDFVKAMDTDLEHVRTHTRLLTRAIEWDKAQRDVSLLLRGNDLNAAEDWLSQAVTKSPIPDDIHEAYITESRRVLRNARNRALFLTGVTVIISLLLIFAIVMGLRAETQRELAEKAEIEARAIALSSAALLNFENKKQDLGLALALEGHQLSPQAATERALASVAYPPGARAYMRVNSPITMSAITPNGEFGITGSQDGILRVWELETGEMLRELTGHTNAVWGLSLSPDGERLVSGSEDRTLIIWDMETGKAMRTLSGHESSVWDVTFSPDGAYIASAGEDGTILLWDGNSGALLHTFTGHDGAVWTARFSPDGSKLISGGADRSVITWDMNELEMIRKYSLHKDTVTDVAFAPDNTTFYSASQDNSLIEWRIQGQTTFGFPGQQHTEAIETMAISPDGNLVATGSEDNRVFVWDVQRRVPVLTFSGHFGTVTTVVFSPDGRRLLSGAEDGSIRYWDLQNGSQVSKHQGSRGDVWSVAFSPDGQYIIGNNDMHLIDYETGENVASFEVEETVNNIEFSPDGSMLAGAAEGGHVYIWDVDTRQIMIDFHGHTQDVWTALFLPDGEHIISGSDDSSLLMWDIETLEVVRSFVGHEGSAWTASLSPDGSLLASASDRGELFLWDVETGELLREFATQAANFNQLESSLEIFEVTFSNDSRFIATGDTNNLVRVWDVESGEQVQRFDGHLGLVSTVAFSSDNSVLVSGGYDNELIMWDVEEGLELRRFSGHTDVVTDANFSPDGNYIVSGSSGGIMRVWFVHSPRELLNWIENNRFIYRMTCFEREQYSLEPENCADGPPPLTIPIGPGEVNLPAPPDGAPLDGAPPLPTISP